MGTTKKFLSVILSVLMILSTVSCLGMVSFAEDENDTEYGTIIITKDDIENDVSMYDPNESVTIKGIVFAIEDGEFTNVDINRETGFSFNCEEDTFYLKMVNSLNITRIVLKSSGHINVDGDSWEFGYDSNFMWNGSADKVYLNGDAADIDYIEIQYEIGPHTHSFTDACKNNDDGTHSQKCFFCNEYSEAVAHKYMNHVCACGADMMTHSEVIAFNGKEKAQSEHFTLNTLSFVDNDGWNATNDGDIVIKAKSDNITITAIDAVVGLYGNFYTNIFYSSGEKVEKDNVVNGSTIHVIDINAKKLEIKTLEYCNFQIKDVTVYYTVDDEIIHRFTGDYKDNGDGTHSQKCIGCDEYGEAESHTFVDFVCVCGVEDTEGKALARAKADAIAEIEAKRTEANSEVADNFIYCITDFALNLKEVEEYKNDGLRQMAIADEMASPEYQEKLAEAKADAIAALKERGKDVPSSVYQSAIDKIEGVEDIRLIKFRREEGVCAIIQYEHPEYPTGKVKDFSCDNSDHNTGLHVFSYGECVDGYVLGCDYDFYYNQIIVRKASSVGTISDFKDGKYAAGWYYYDEATDAYIYCDGHGTAYEHSQAKADAIAEIKAAKTEANASIAEKAIADINAATSADEIARIKTKALTDMYYADQAAALAEAKKKGIADINAAAEAAGSSPAIQEIVEEAIKEINAADVLRVVNLCVSDALERIEIIASRPEDAPAGEDFNECACSTHPGCDHLYSFGKVMGEDDMTFVAGLQYVYSKNSVDFNGAILPLFTDGYEPGWYYYDETGLLIPCDGHVTAEEILAQAKADAIAEIENVKTGASFAIAAKAVTDIEAATSVDDVNTIKTKALADMAKADEDAAYGKALTAAKDEALEAVDSAKEAAISDAAKNVSIYPIFNAVTLEEVAAAKAEALNAIAAAEKALADAKTAAITEINAAKTEANATIAEKAITDINAATAVDNVATIKTKALADMAKADEEAAAVKALADAKADAIAAIEAAKTEYNAEYAEYAKYKINTCETVETVNHQKELLLEDMARIDADERAAVAEAKTAAVAEINTAKTEANKAVAEKAVADINAATKVDDVNTIKTKALADMAKADEDAAAAAKALADAKDAAVAEAEAKLTADSTDEEKALVEEVVNAINSADSIEAVKKAKADFNAKWEALHADTPEEPIDGCCNNPVAGICNTYNKYIDVPVLNIILKVIHVIVHFFHGDF